MVVLSGEGERCTLETDTVVVGLAKDSCLEEEECSMVVSAKDVKNSKSYRTSQSKFVSRVRRAIADLRRLASARSSKTRGERGRDPF